MEKKWGKSEKYRKYLIELQFEGHSNYAIWGTNLKHKEEDVFLTKGEKIVLFSGLNNLRINIIKFRSFFFDESNFEKWVIEENLESVYTIMKINSLVNFEPNCFHDKMRSIDLLNALNIIQDFFVQIKNNNLLLLFSDPDIVEIKEFIYNNYFWRKDKQVEIAIPEFRDFNTVKINLSNIYDGFNDRTLVVG